MFFFNIFHFKNTNVDLSVADVLSCLFFNKFVKEFILSCYNYWYYIEWKLVFLTLNINNKS